MHQFARIVARNSAFGMAAQLVIKLLSFGFSVLIVRSLGAQEYGQYAAVLAFGALFVFVADLGLGPYTVREVARRRGTPGGAEYVQDLFGNVLRLRFALSLVAATLLIGTAWLTGRPLVMVVAIALGTLGLVMYSAQGACEAVLAGFERLDITAGAKVAYQLVFVLVGALALVLHAGYFGLIGANLLGIAIITLVCWRAVRAIGVRPGAASLLSWPDLLRASLPFGVIALTLGLSYRFDSVLLNIFRGDAETGYYSAAYNLVFSAVILSNVINTTLYPSLTRQSAADPASLSAIYSRALRYLLLAALPIAAGGSALAEEIVPFLFGSGYAPAIPVLRIVIWVTPLMFASEFLGYVVLVSGRERKAARAVMVSTGANVLCNLLLVPRFGLLGAAAMTVATEAILVGQYVWILRSELRGIDWKPALLGPLAAALAMALLVRALPILPLPLTVALGAACYGALLLALRVIGPDEMRFVQQLRRRSEARP
jgi:O-antigen/teichoic acid export membrane protein